MIKVNFYKLTSIEDNKLAFAVIMSKFQNKWIYVKHKDRPTWEIPGGHRELNESIIEAASRELFEETGAKKFKLTPICIYAVESNEEVNYTKSFGELFYAEIEELGELPEYEIKEIKFFSYMPKELTYPLIQPLLNEKVLDFMSRYEGIDYDKKDKFAN